MPPAGLTNFDADVALVGTGLAPLVAAARLMAEGRSVLLLNPEWDFFGESSELPLDPLCSATTSRLSPQRLSRSLPDSLASTLRPDFPGAIELWSSPGAGGFRDELAPHIRARSRVWIQSESTPQRAGFWDWEQLEAMYVEASDASMTPQLADGLVAIRKFPGVAGKVPELKEVYRAVQVPRLCDVDVARYQNGLLEFVRERLGPERVLCASSQMDLIPEGIRFHWNGGGRTARLSEGVLCFWTPRLTQWVQGQAKRAEVRPPSLRGVRVWEEWSVASRESLDPSLAGNFEDLVAWADIEGAPRANAFNDRLNILRPGPSMPLESLLSGSAPPTQASQDSFKALSRLCLGFLRWDYFTVRALRARVLMDWGDEVPPPWRMGGELSRAFVVPGSDGPVMDVVRNARAACDLLLGGGP